MIDKKLIEQFLNETPTIMLKESRSSVQAFFLRFFNSSKKTECREFEKLDFIEIFREMNLAEESTFETYKSRIKSFMMWMNKTGDVSKRQIDEISSISFQDVESTEYDFNTHYFSDFYDLWKAIKTAFDGRGTEFDTFKATALLLWFGIELDGMPDILKTDILDEEKCIVHPINKSKVFISEFAIEFLSKYRDEAEFDSSKFGGSTQKYAQGAYLIRTSRNAHLTLKQLRNIVISANVASKNTEKKFKWKAIYQSGAYFRLFQYEQKYGAINENEYEMLKNFFQEKNTNRRKRILSQKYNKYCKFKNMMLL